MVFIAPPADSTPQPGLLALSRAAFHGGIGGKCPGNRSLGAPIINNIKNDTTFSPLLAKVSSRIDQWCARSISPLACASRHIAILNSRIHTCEPSFPAHLKLDLVRTAGFTLLPGQVHVSPTAAWGLNCLPSAWELADFPNCLVRLLVFPSCLPQSSNFGNDSLAGLCGQKSFK